MEVKGRDRWRNGARMFLFPFSLTTQNYGRYPLKRFASRNVSKSTEKFRLAGSPIFFYLKICEIISMPVWNKIWMRWIMLFSMYICSREGWLKYKAVALPGIDKIIWAKRTRLSLLLSLPSLSAFDQPAFSLIFLMPKWHIWNIRYSSRPKISQYLRHENVNPRILCSSEILIFVSAALEFQSVRSGCFQPERWRAEYRQLSEKRRSSRKATDIDLNVVMQQLLQQPHLACTALRKVDWPSLIGSKQAVKKMVCQIFTDIFVGNAIFT